MKQNKNRRRLPVPSEKTQRSRIVVIIGGLLLVVTAVLLHTNNAQPLPEPHPISAPQEDAGPSSLMDAPEITPAEIAQLEYTHRRLTRGLSTVAQGDDQATQLVAFFKRCAFYGRPRRNRYVSLEVAGGATVDEPCRFGIIIGSDDEFEAVGAERRSIFEYRRNLQMILLPPLEDFSDLWVGVIALHELLHAYNHLILDPPGTPDPTSQEDPEVLAEEVQCHSLEMRLLELHSHGRFVATLDRIVQRRAPEAGAIPYPGIVAEDGQLLRTIYPPHAGQDANMLYTQSIVGLNFRHADRFPDALPRKMAFLRELYRVVLPSRTH